MNLNQVTISVSDLDRSVAFYQKLGLLLIVFTPNHYARFECPDGDSTFSLHQGLKEIPAAGTCIYFETDNLDELVNNLQQEGIRFEEEPTDKPWLWREARLKDPDQNQLILYHAGKFRKNPPWRIKD